MGEYVGMVGGGAMKIGTCEDMYYVRYADLAGMIARKEVERQAGSLDPEKYLEDGYGLRFRFPFPDEDADPMQYASISYDRGYAIANVPAYLFGKADDHGVAMARIACSTGANWPKATVRMPCPQSTEAAPDTLELEFVFQKRVGDELWTVVRCPYCRGMWRMDAEEGVRMAEWMIERSNGVGEWTEVARRIMDGYNVPRPDGSAPVGSIAYVSPKIEQDVELQLA